MEIIPIFAPHLTAFRFGKTDEFHQLFANWNDAEYLFEFFKRHEKDLQSDYYGSITVAEAVRRTRRYALQFENCIEKLSSNLDNVFTPLRELEGSHLPRSKARENWLRIYAIKVEANIYVVTGGGIKLTRTMNESPHLKVELNKLQRGRAFLKEHGISDIDGLAELIIPQ
ncbi:MAG: hypothetical protein KatS3mg032_0926 [Cyclobacteriaceae bacterium]|nr:MAG: hypothetical protein KatS3mg032_0926 [Cyclobacteriaceae bacterium]